MDLAKWIRAQWDRVLAWVCVVAGAIVLLVGWAGVSRYAYPADQLPYIISGGIGGLFLLGLGAMLWLSADLRDEWRKLDEIDRRNARFYDGHQPAPPVAFERRVFEAPVHHSVPEMGPVTAPARDDTRETSVVGRTSEAVDASPSEAAPAKRRPSSSRRSTTAAASPAPRAATGRRSPKQGLAQP